MRLVIDTDVVVAALRSPTGASAVLLAKLLERRATMLLTVALALEYEAICMLPKHRHAAEASEEEVAILIDALIAIAEPVEVHYHWRPQLADAGDEMVLEAAVNGRAEAIVSFNRRDFGTAPRRFGIELISPGEALMRIIP
jgi:putative PIN family toxin of toxin-antitoxin system